MNAEMRSTAESTIAQSPAIIDDTKLSNRVTNDLGTVFAVAGAGSRGAAGGAVAGAGADVVVLCGAGSFLFFASDFRAEVLTGALTAGSSRTGHGRCSRSSLDSALPLL
ncbi:hypothetical protein GCM10009587_02660 [Microbacterium maritypicum]